jgi:photosynthetic reaction center cytochrome c subunit
MLAYVRVLFCVVLILKRIDAIASSRKEMAKMNVDFKGCFRCAKYAALAMTVAFVLWMPVRMAGRTFVHGVYIGRDAGPETQKTAGEAFKNIQVLKDIPAGELIPSMRYVSAALGVGCDYCHEADHFDNDDKPTKQRARNMMKMMFAINQDNFNGRREVTCYTCHRGVAKAANIAPLSSAPNTAGRVSESGETGTASTGVAPTGASGSTPSMNEILAKYVDAIGGSGAIQKNQTRAEQGSVEGPHGLHAAIETYRTAPDKAFAIVHRPNGDVMEGVDGNVGWGKRANGEVTEESGDELARSRQWAEFYPGEHFEKDYERFKMGGIENVNGHDAYVITAWWKDGGADRIYFDVQSGLLLRITHRIESPLGALPLQTDYEDYREVNGLKIPFAVRVTRVDGTTTYTWQKMDANVTIDPSRYEKPVKKSAAEEPLRPEAKP